MFRMRSLEGEKNLPVAMQSKALMPTMCQAWTPRRKKMGMLQEERECNGREEVVWPHPCCMRI